MSETCWRKVVLVTLFVAVGMLGWMVDKVMAQSGAGLDMLEQKGGVFYAVAVQGNYAYVGMGPRLVVLNVEDAAHPTFVAWTPPLPDLVKGVALSGQYAYVANGSAGLQVVDVTDPAAPRIVASYDTPGDALAVVVNGDRAYVADGRSGLQIVDISDPTAPKVPPAGELREYVDEGGLAVASGVAVQGNVICLAYGSLGVHILDATNATAPFVGQLLENEYVWDVALISDTLYTAAGSYGLYLHRLDNLQSPTLLSKFVPDAVSRLTHLAVAGNVVYLSDTADDGAAKLRAVDVTTPTQPVDAGYVATPGQAENLAVAGSYAYVADGDGGLRVVDLSAVAGHQLKEVGAFTSVGFPLRVVAQAPYLYIASKQHGLQIVDLAAACVTSCPSAVGEYALSDLPVGLAIAEDYAYLAGKSGTLSVVRITNPTSPTLVGTHSGMAAPNDLAVAGDYAYVVTQSGLYIVDISTPQAPARRSFYRTGQSLKAIAVAGDYVYTLDLFIPQFQTTSYLRVFDVTSPISPTPVLTYSLYGTTNDLALQGDYAYVTVDNTLRVVNIRTLTESGQVTLPDVGLRVVVDGNMAYVGTQGGVYAVRITDPAHPALVGSYTLPVVTTIAEPLALTDLDVEGGNLYIADGEGGLFTLQYGVSVTASPVGEVTLSYPDAQTPTLQIVIPADVVPVTTTLRCSPATPPAGAEGNLAMAAATFHLSAWRGGIRLSTYPFSRPVSATLYYGRAGFPPTADLTGVTLRWWDGSQWQEIASACGATLSVVRDPDAQTLRVPLCKLGYYALFAPTHRLFLPLIVRQG